MLWCVAIVLSIAPASAEMYIKVDFDSNDDPAIMHEFAGAVNHVAAEHPEVRGITVATIASGSLYYAYAEPRKIVLNDLYSSSYEVVARSVEYDIAQRYHPPLGHCTPVEYLGYHEAAHVLDIARGKVAREALSAKYGFGSTVRTALSGYSFDDDGILRPVEALAEAFAAVKCNGGNIAE
ncbi:hypothetical protein [Mycobacterium phage WXIN]|nr:hypothetical protein [Mycobacterium phage WXIN]